MNEVNSKSRLFRLAIQQAGRVKQEPRGAIHAQLIGRGRIWVESISLDGTALVRFDPDTGIRSRQHKVKLDEIDFGFVGGNGWKEMPR